ncbi:MAG TPA: hypothetical protein VGD08_06070 [Stellaceae bacterium]
MTDTLLRQVALVAESQLINASDLTKVSAALQKQATRDLVQFWGIKATVDAFPRLEDVPVGYWPIVIMDNIGQDAEGIHLDKNNQPFALVTAREQVDAWSLTASHEMIEMLVDPFGMRLTTSDSPKADQGRAQFLVEPCDPSEAAEFAYTANGILVSDFYSVRYFDPVAAPGVRYSFTGAIREPRQVLRGGYLSWLDIASDTWWQEIWFSSSEPTFRNLGQISASDGSFRSQIDRRIARETAQALSGGISAARAAGVPVMTMTEASTQRAFSLRQQIEELTAGTAERGETAERATRGEIAGMGGWRTQAQRSEGRRSDGRRSGSRRGGNGSQTESLRTAPSVWPD